MIQWLKQFFCCFTGECKPKPFCGNAMCEDCGLAYNIMALEGLPEDGWIECPECETKTGRVLA